jgi:hypothetical protein
VSGKRLGTIIVHLIGLNLCEVSQLVIFYCDFLNLMIIQLLLKFHVAILGGIIILPSQLPSLIACDVKSFSFFIVGGSLFFALIFSAASMVLRR